MNIQFQPLPDYLPPTAVSSLMPIVILRADRSISSEHSTTPDAVKALARFGAQFPTSEAGIFRRLSGRWVKYLAFLGPDPTERSES